MTQLEFSCKENENVIDITYPKDWDKEKRDLVSAFLQDTLNFLSEYCQILDVVAEDSQKCKDKLKDADSLRKIIGQILLINNIK